MISKDQRIRENFARLGAAGKIRIQFLYQDTAPEVYAAARSGDRQAQADFIIFNGLLKDAAGAACLLCGGRVREPGCVGFVRQDDDHLADSTSQGFVICEACALMGRASVHELTIRAVGKMMPDHDVREAPPPEPEET